jgi:hypothetical protein
MPIKADEGDTVAVDLTIERNGMADRHASGIAVVRITKPNGPDCGPQCRFAHGRLVGNRIEPLN